MGDAEGLLSSGLEQAPPREVAAMLLCMRHDIAPHHPQTVFEQLAETRKGMFAMDPSKAPRRKRGRPARRRNI